MKFSLIVDVPETAGMTEAEARQIVYDLFIVDNRGAVHEKLLDAAKDSGPTADALRSSYRASLELIDTAVIERVT
ncbi:hypothetical protein [Rhizobium sp. BK176]|uniref:hypothetical protein n=1 Tax=Rhizobium sp. BK176 TaxID=2587071 RepID=UPI002167E284|nr:hypothetical protein [Rhizobium sp. BK176]MCS4088830.1 hypothetical protein [Rhizobium sp. BK176]